MRLSPKDAALKFVNRNFPKCQAAVLAGSVVRGEETETSDLDVVIFDKNFSSSYRESFIEYGWAIEAFVHNLTSYQVFFFIVIGTEQCLLYQKWFQKGL